MGRKNAKTTLSACLLLAHLCGPPAKSKPNSQLYSAAQSRDQAAIIFSLAAKMTRMNPALARIVTIQETAKSLVCTELGTRYRALSADATTAYGLSPQLVIHDELGQVRGPRSALFEALETATGAQDFAACAKAGTITSIAAEKIGYANTVARWEIRDQSRGSTEGRFPRLALRWLLRLLFAKHFFLAAGTA